MITIATRHDRVIWRDDTRYRYDLHGPLTSIELGTEKTQDMNHAYTLTRRLKRINTNMTYPYHALGMEMTGAAIAVPFMFPLFRMQLAVILHYSSSKLQSFL